MTALVQQSPRETPVQPEAIPPHVLTVGKKRAADYVAPALFRLGTFGELLVKAKGRLSIATAVDVAEMVKRNITGLAQAITIGTTELVTDGIGRAVSFIEIHLDRGQPEVRVTEIPSQELPEEPQTPALEAPSPVPALPAPAVQAPKKKKRKAAKRKVARKTAKKKKKSRS